MVACVIAATLASMLKGVTSLEYLDSIAKDYASLSGLEREYGYRPRVSGIIGNPEVVERARSAMPLDARYAVIVGDRWRPVRETVWSSHLEADFLRFYLLPRREVPAPEASWVFCFACDTERLRGRFETVTSVPSGLRVLRVYR